MKSSKYDIGALCLTDNVVAPSERHKTRVWVQSRSQYLLVVLFFKGIQTYISKLTL